MEDEEEEEEEEEQQQRQEQIEEPRYLAINSSRKEDKSQKEEKIELLPMQEMDSLPRKGKSFFLLEFQIILCNSFKLLTWCFRLVALSC